MQIEIVCSIPYKYTRGPLEISPERFNASEEERTKGANCQLVVCAVALARGHEDIPHDYLSQEILLDPDSKFYDVQPHEQFQTGDIIGFWPRRDSRDPKSVHVGTLRITKHGIEVHHASKMHNNVVTEPLLAVLQRYNSIACVRRSKQINKAATNPTALRRLGFLE